MVECLVVKTSLLKEWLIKRNNEYLKLYDRFKNMVWGHVRGGAVIISANY